MKKFIASRYAFAGLALAALSLTACFSDHGSNPSEDGAIRISMKVTQRPATGLGKGSVIKLKKLIVTLTSSYSGDAVIRDTIIAADTLNSKFVSSTADSQNFTKNYGLVPLRNWKVVVKTLDTRDSVIHIDSATAMGLLAGETRNIALNLNARFVQYEVKFRVPDSLKSSISGQAQDIIISRLLLKIDGVNATDTTSPLGGGFQPGVIHSAYFDYIRAGTTPDVTIEFWGHSPGSTDTLMFRAQIDDVDPTVPLTSPIPAVYVGPGSGPGGGGATGNVSIKIGKVHTVVFEVEPDGTVAVKRPSR